VRIDVPALQTVPGEDSYGSGRLDTAPIGPFQDGQQLQVERHGDGQRRVRVPGARLERAELQRFLDGQDIDTRTVWTGNAARQPIMSAKSFRVPPAASRGPTRSWRRESYYLATMAWVTSTCNFVIDRLQAFLDAR
jgi:hypothetical protein